MVAPHRVSPPDEMPTVQVVLRVDRLPGLLAYGDAGVKVPVIAPIDVDELVTVDVHSSHDRKATHRLQKNGEVCVEQLASSGFCGRFGSANGTSRKLSSYPVRDTVAASMPIAKQQKPTFERRQRVTYLTMSTEISAGGYAT